MKTLPTRWPCAAVTAGALLAATPAAAQVTLGTGAGTGRWYFGGSVGAGFGDIDYVHLQPLVGYRVDTRLTVGATAILRLRNDQRFERDVSTTDYGASVFGRLGIAGPFFAQAEVEQLSYEYLRPDLSTARGNATSVYGGGGVAQALDNNMSLFAVALYNFSQSSHSAPGPYSSPWVLRFGVAVGF
jgi:hypothetical protein